MRGKIIVIDGTDCSGKETQSRLLVERLNREGIRTESMSFPRYATPTGKIVGGPYLGKQEIAPSYFPEGAANVDPRVASGLYAIDRRAALPEINQFLNEGTNLVFDRYVQANMGHQGGKIRDPQERQRFYEALDALEYGFMELPRADKTLFLYMPYQIGMKLAEGRNQARDGHENDSNHLRNAEEAYLQLSEIYGWEQIDCAPFVNFENPDKGKKELSEIIFEKVRTLF